MTDISQAVVALCDALDLDPGHVHRIEIQPTRTLVELYRLNDAGLIYINDEGEVARYMRSFDTSKRAGTRLGELGGVAGSAVTARSQAA